MYTLNKMLCFPTYVVRSGQFEVDMSFCQHKACIIGSAGLYPYIIYLYYILSISWISKNGCCNRWRYAVLKDDQKVALFGLLKFGPY
jgi:hypothetical protein